MELRNQAVAGVIDALLSGRSLRQEEARALAMSMLSGGLDEAQIAAVLVALRAKGESGAEVAGFAKALLESCVKLDGLSDSVDTAGTGGDGHHTFNVSTASAIVAASLGARVVKHGNKGVSSRSGSADFMAKLGYPVEHDPLQAPCIFRRTGFVFLYAPNYHPLMARVMGVRRRIGVRTVFNLAGPLANPAGVRRRLLGVAREPLVSVMGEAMRLMGVERGFVVHGEPGLDEVSVSGRTLVLEVKSNSVDEYVVEPSDLGLGTHKVSELRVGGPGESAGLFLALVRGVHRGAVRDFLLANTGFVLHLAGLVKDPRDGVELARQGLEEGRVRAFLDSLRGACGECVGLRSAG